MARLILLGGPTGVGKSTALKHLQGRIPNSALLDADDVWRVSKDIAVSPARPIAIGNVVSVMRGYFAANCEVGILAWVFARSALYQPVIDGLDDLVDSAKLIYLISDLPTLESRLAARGDTKRFEYAKSRLSLIDALPFTKIDTSNLSPIEVADRISNEINPRD